MEIWVIVFALFTLTLMLSFMAVLQIKRAGMNVTDFWSFVKANEVLDKLYAFSSKYENMSPQQQIIFLQESEKIFSAFNKVPDQLWEDEYNKYMKVLNTYNDIKAVRWMDKDGNSPSKKSVIRPTIVKATTTSKKRKKAST